MYEEADQAGLRTIKWVGLGVLAVIGLILFMMTCYSVGETERVVLTRWGSYVETQDPGLHVKMPFMYSTKSIPVSIQKDFSTDPANTYTRDNQEVDVTYSVLYRINPKDVEWTYKNTTDVHALFATLVIPAMKNIMGQMEITEVPSHRGQIEQQIYDSLKKSASSYHIEVLQFVLQNMDYTKVYREAINKAAVQKAAAEQAQFDLQRIKIEADQVETAAKGKAQARLAEATAEAQAIRVQGEATAAAMEAKQKALAQSQALVEYVKATQWNGQLPRNMYGAAPIPFLNVDQPTASRK